jgi:hypothetical protein
VPDEILRLATVQHQHAGQLLREVSLYIVRLPLAGFAKKPNPLSLKV